MSGDVDKLVVEEIGPIVYREKLEHLNVSRNANGTMSFVSRRSVIFMPEKNDIDMNATIIVPNYAVLVSVVRRQMKVSPLTRTLFQGMVSFLHDASFLTKMAVNLLLRSVGSPAFINTTVYNFLWNFSDPILEAGQRIVPDLVPSTNIGMLETVSSGTSLLPRRLQSSSSARSTGTSRTGATCTSAPGRATRGSS